MKPGYQEQILYILNKHHSIVTVELGDAVTDDILQLIDTATREAIQQYIEPHLQACRDDNGRDSCKNCGLRPLQEQSDQSNTKGNE